MKRILPFVLLCASALGASLIPIQVDKTTRVLASPTNAWTANKAGITAAVLATPTASASVAGWLSDETGTAGSVVFSASPTLSGVLSIGAGSAAAPALVYSSDTNTGWYWGGADDLYVSLGGQRSVRFTTDTISLGSSSDAVFRRTGVSGFAFGAADAAVPVAQTISVQNVAAGTLDTTGANFTIDASRGTGANGSGNIIFRVAPAGTTGTSQNALAAAFTVSNNGATRQGSAGTGPQLYPFSGSAYTTTAIAGQGQGFYNNCNTAGDIARAFAGANITVTSGSFIGNLFARSFAPTSGTATYAELQVIPIINQTGGANGITRGIWINPTLTAAADFRAIEVTTGNVVLSPASELNWNKDSVLVRAAADTLAMRRGSNLQNLRLYGTYSDDSNGEWLAIESGSTVFDIKTVANGTGTANSLRFGTGGSSRWQIDTSGHYTAVTDNVYDIGQSGATRPRTGYFGTDVNAGGAITATGNLSGARLLATSGVGDTSYIRFGANPNYTYVVAAAVDTLQIGAGGGTPTAQTLRGPYAAGTDVAGGTLAIEGGRNTGAGRGGDVVNRTANSGASGASLGTLSTRRYDSAKWVDLTESTDSQIATVACGTGKHLGAQLVVTVNAEDASDFQALTSTLNVNAVNKSGTITSTVTQVDGTTAASAGTLTATYVVTDNGSGVLGIKVNAVSSLTQTQLRAKWSIVALNSNDAATVTPN